MSATTAPAPIEWTFEQECPIPPEVQWFLVPGEQPWTAYTTFRAWAVFTDKRLLVRDSLGLTARRPAMYSLPYPSIKLWCSAGPGAIDPAQIKLWTESVEIKILLRKGVDVLKLETVISRGVLGVS